MNIVYVFLLMHVQCEDIQSKAGLLVRVYEAHGSHTTATLTCPLAKGFER